MTTNTKNWWDDYSNIVMVAAFMAGSSDCSAEDVAYMIEKPWKFTEYYHAAKEHETQT